MDVEAYRRIDESSDDLAEGDRVLGSLTQQTRDLMLATLETDLEPADLEEIRAALHEITLRLRKASRPGPLGVQVTSDGQLRNHGNAVVGLRNPVAPPLRVERDPAGRSRASFSLGPLHEGPPGLVHGGVSALILDQMLGEAAAAARSPGMTARLSLTYRRPTPLGALSAEAWIDRTEGYKTTVKGELRDAEGNPTVEAEGLFILPRWAREALAKSPAPAAFE